MNTTVQIRADSAPLEAIFQELQELVEIGNLSLELRQRLLSFLEGSSELVRIQTDDRATRTGTLLVTLHPSDRLLGLLAACRAGNLDRFLVKESLTH